MSLSLSLGGSKNPLCHTCSGRNPKKRPNFQPNLNNKIAVISESGINVLHVIIGLFGPLEPLPPNRFPLQINWTLERVQLKCERSTPSYFINDDETEDVPITTMTTELFGWKRPAQFCILVWNMGCCRTGIRLYIKSNDGGGGLWGFQFQ